MSQIDPLQAIYMKKLSEKATKFCECYIKNWYNARDAYKEAYWQTDWIKASVWAYQLLKDPRVVNEIDEQMWTFKTLGYKTGMTKDSIVKMLALMMHAERKSKNWTEPDWTARFNAIMGFTKLTGDLTEKKKIEVNVPEEVEDVKKDLAKLEWKELLAERKKILERMTFK